MSGHPPMWIAADYDPDEIEHPEITIAWLRGEGWQADCPQCVGSKFTCDGHRALANKPQP